MSDQPAHGTQDYADDPRNDAVLVYVNGEPNPGSRRWCRCSTPDSCSATTRGRACGSNAGIELTNVLLIRYPREVLASYTKTRAR